MTIEIYTSNTIEAYFPGEQRASETLVAPHDKRINEQTKPLKATNKSLSTDSIVSSYSSIDQMDPVGFQVFAMFFSGQKPSGKGTVFGKPGFSGYLWMENEQCFPGFYLKPSFPICFG